MNAPPLSELFRQSLKIGCLGFGGPVGQIALMHRVFVEERAWIDDARFQRMLAFCMLLPGPEAQQLATYVGWRLRGWAGALVAGWLFVLPGALIVLALSWFYVRFGAAPAVVAAFDGVKCAVVALVAEALWKVGKRALKTRGALLIALASFAALQLGAPFPLVIVAAGLWGAAAPSPLAGEVSAKRPDEGRSDMQAPGSLHTPHPPASSPPRDREAVPQTLDSPAAKRPVGGGGARLALVWLILWLAPVALIAATFGTGHILFQIALLFSILACVTFGGAYAVLAYLATETVARGWLTTAQMIDGLGLAETTPGPLILVNQFVGFLAGWGEGGAWLALGGAMLALWCTFAPSFVWIFAGAPYAERLQGNARASAALAAITAAVLGVIASLALFFATHALFAARLHWGPLQLPDPGSARLWMLALALAAGVALMRFKTNLLAVILSCALLGLAARAGGL